MTYLNIIISQFLSAYLYMSILLLRLNLNKNIEFASYNKHTSIWDGHDQSELLNKIEWKEIDLKKSIFKNKIESFFIKDLDKLIIFIKTVDNKYFKRKFDGIQIWEPITEDKFTNEKYKSNFFDDSIVTKWPTNNPVSILKTPQDKWVDTKITSCNFFKNYYPRLSGPGGPLKNDCIFGETNGMGIKNKYYLPTCKNKWNTCYKEWLPPCEYDQEVSGIMQGEKLVWLEWNYTIKCNLV